MPSFLAEVLLIIFRLLLQNELHTYRIKICPRFSGLPRSALKDKIFNIDGENRDPNSPMTDPELPKVHETFVDILFASDMYEGVEPIIRNCCHHTMMLRFEPDIHCFLAVIHDLKSFTKAPAGFNTAASIYGL